MCGHAGRWGGSALEQASRGNNPVLCRMLALAGAKLSKRYQRRRVLQASLTGSRGDISLLTKCQADFCVRNYDQVRCWYLASQCC